MMNEKFPFFYCRKYVCDLQETCHNTEPRCNNIKEARECYEQQAEEESNG